MLRINDQTCDGQEMTGLKTICHMNETCEVIFNLSKECFILEVVLLVITHPCIHYIHMSIRGLTSSTMQTSEAVDEK